MNCLDCVFWSPLLKRVVDDDMERGECRIRAPQVYPRGGNGYGNAWPITKAIDWCGEVVKEEDA